MTASLAAKAEQLGLDSLEGRARAAETIFPSNPTLSVTGGYPIEPSLRQRELLWSANLSQEIEVGGQRAARRALVSSEQRAQQARLWAVQRVAAVDALLMYYDALAAREEAKIAERLTRLATSLKAAARGRAEAGLSADVDAQLAEASATRLLQAQLAAERHVVLSTAALATVVGVNPTQTTMRVEGDMMPLDQVDTTSASFIDSAIARRAEINVALAESKAHAQTATLYERLRIPNPTLSLFARNDWVAERLLGVGISVPIPLPGPVGRTFAGEIAEASALALRAQTEAERLRRDVRLDVLNAVDVLSFRKREAELYSADQIRMTEDTLQSNAEEIEARRLPIREALLTQQALIEYLLAYAEARRQLCFASVELARAAGLPLERGGQ